MQVLCGQCGKTIDVDDEDAGSTILCPECEHEIPVPRFDEDTPDKDGSEDTAFDLSDQSDGFAAEAKQAMARKVHVVCGSCDRGLTVSARLAGKKVRCPACGVKIRIPYPDEGEDELVLRKMTASHNEQMTRLDLSSSSAEEEFAGSDIPRRKVQMPEPRKAPPFWIMIAGGAAAALVIGILIGPRLFAPRDNGSGDPSDGIAEDRPVRPRPPGPVPPPTRPTATKPAPAARQAEIAVKHVTFEDFAANGYFPARPGRLYWHVTALIRAGAKGARFRTYGKDVTLNVGGRDIESDGLQPREWAPPIAGRRMNIRLGPDQSRELTFVFNVPVTTRSATLNITSVTSADVELADRPRPPAAGRLAGRYREVAPRNLRPLLRDPVMRAIQAAANQTLVVDKMAAGQYPVWIPAAGVRGLAKPSGKGIYDLLLRHEASGRELPCKIRAISDGERIVLFLSDKPFHQITYSSREVPGPPPRSRPTPVVRAPVKPEPTERPRRTRPYRTPHETMPAPAKPHTSRLPKDHGRKTIFDF